jgi:hypothetical protein
MWRIFFLLFLLAGAAEAAPIYQCKDAKGAVTITDKPCGPDAVSSKSTEMTMPTDKARESARKMGIVGEPLRKINCDAHRSAMASYDRQLLDALKRGDVGAQKQLYESRRRWGNAMHEFGC